MIEAPILDWTSFQNCQVLKHPEILQGLLVRAARMHRPSMGAWVEGLETGQPLTRDFLPWKKSRLCRVWIAVGDHSWFLGLKPCSDAYLMENCGKAPVSLRYNPWEPRGSTGDCSKAQARSGRASQLQIWVKVSLKVFWVRKQLAEAHDVPWFMNHLKYLQFTNLSDFPWSLLSDRWESVCQLGRPPKGKPEKAKVGILGGL